MSKFAALIALLKKLGPAAVEAWPHIVAIIEILARQPSPQFAPGVDVPGDNDEQQEFVELAKAAGVSESDAQAAADVLTGCAD